MFAVLETLDFFWIWVIVSLVVGTTTVYALLKPSDAARLSQLEAKLDLIIKHFGLEYKDSPTLGGLSSEVRALADDPSQKIAAIKLHREQTGLGLKDAKDAVEAYMAGRG